VTRSGALPTPRERSILVALRAGPLSVQALAAELKRPQAGVSATMPRLMSAHLVRMRFDITADPPAKVFRLSLQGRRLLRARPVASHLGR
jgi:predicted ArsR family transcriptional regulator